jgi:hypothetical protein
LDVCHSETGRNRCGADELTVVRILCELAMFRPTELSIETGRPSRNVEVCAKAG